MFRLDIKLPVNFAKEIEAEIIKANDAAIRAAANYAIGPLRANMPVKSGRMQQQTQIHFFTRRSGMLGAALKVMGDRHFVSRILEDGASSHGGRRPARFKVPLNRKTGKPSHPRVKPGSRFDRGPIAARHMFALTWAAIEAQAGAIYTQTFSANFNPKP